MRFIIIVISIVCLLYGFSQIITFVITCDKEVLKHKTRLIGLGIGVILLIVGFALLPVAF